MKTKEQILEALNKPKFTEAEVDALVNEATEKLYKAALEGRNITTYKIGRVDDKLIEAVMNKLSKLGFHTRYDIYDNNLNQVFNFTISTEQLLSPLLGNRPKVTINYDDYPLGKFYTREW